jgi:glutaredoxin
MLLPEGLHTLNLKTNICYKLPSFIRQLLNSATVKTLKRVSITAPVELSATPYCLETDAALAEIGFELEEVHVNFNKIQYHQQAKVELTMRASMPKMSAKGILRISLSRGLYLSLDMKLSHSYR